jgi:hypothetical protein
MAAPLCLHWQNGGFFSVALSAPSSVRLNTDVRRISKHLRLSAQTAQHCAARAFAFEDGICALRTAAHRYSSFFGCCCSHVGLDVATKAAENRWGGADLPTAASRLSSLSIDMVVVPRQERHEPAPASGLATLPLLSCLTCLSPAPSFLSAAHISPLFNTAPHTYTTQRGGFGRLR